MDKAELVGLWNSFIAGFCKVEFLCHGGEPNWLGWIVIGWVGLVGAALCIALFVELLGNIVISIEKAFQARRRE